MDLTVMLVAISPFLMVVAIVWIAVRASASNRQKTLHVVEEAIRSGQQLTPETIRALGMPRKDGNRDLKSGGILIAVAIGFMLLGAAVYAAEGDREALYIMPAIASFPGLIGLVLVGFGLSAGKTKNDDRA